MTHFDIANIFFKIFKNKYRYIGKKKWEYFDIHSKIWVLDIKNNRLSSDIKIVISDLFIQRSLYWSELAKTLTDINDEIRAKMTSEKLVIASYKLKNEQFISVVIKEAQSFFDMHNIDD